MSRDGERPRHVFQSFWLGDRLSPLEHLCIKSFVAHGHEFVLYAYDEVANLPPGCRVEDARAILGPEHVFLLRSGWFKGGASGFSDRFRYVLLQARGGWWVDTDVLCLKDEIPDAPYVFALQDPYLYNNAILKAPADSAFLSKAIARCERYEVDDIDVATLAPELVTELVRELSLEGHAWPPERLYPLRVWEVLAYLEPAEADRIEALVESSMFLHFWNNMFRLTNVLKDIGPPEGSYLDRLYRAYGVELPYGRRYEWSEIEPQVLFQAERWELDQQIEHLDADLRQLHGEREPQAAGEHSLLEVLASARAEVQRFTYERAQLARYEQSVTIQLFCRLSDRVYGTIGQGSLLGRAIQATLRLIGRLIVRGGDHRQRHDMAPKPEAGGAAR